MGDFVTAQATGLKPHAGGLVQGEADAQGAATHRISSNRPSLGRSCSRRDCRSVAGRVGYRSSGVRPLCLAIRASILGPISSWS